MYQSNTCMYFKESNTLPSFLEEQQKKQQPSIPISQNSRHNHLHPSVSPILLPYLFFSFSSNHSLLACIMDVEDLAPSYLSPPPTTHTVTVNSSCVLILWYNYVLILVSWVVSSYFDYINIMCLQGIVLLWLFFLFCTIIFPRH